MKQRSIMILALLLACLAVFAACGRPAQGNNTDDPDPGQTGTVDGNGTGSTDGDGNTDGTGTGSTDGSGNTDGSGTGADPFAGINQGEAFAVYDNWAYFSGFSGADAARSVYLLRQQIDGEEKQILMKQEGKAEVCYAEGSLEASGNAALFFSLLEEDGSGALYCYDLYSNAVRQVLAAPCGNMVVFSGGGRYDGYGWVLQQDYVMPVRLKSQTADMSMAASTMEVGGLMSVGDSFFTDSQYAVLKESEYGVLEITLIRQNEAVTYLYTCDTFTATRVS